MTDGVTITLNAATMRRLEAVVVRSGLGPWLETELEAATERGRGRHHGGRRRALGADALLVGMLATTWAGQPLMLRTVVRVLNDLHPSTKRRLHVPGAAEGGVTERHVSYLFGRITALVDPSPHSETNRDRYERLRDAAPAPAHPAARADPRPHRPRPAADRRHRRPPTADDDLTRTRTADT